MDYKDVGVVGLAVLGGGAGGALAGPVGVVGGVVAGSAVGAKWASESDAVRDLRERVAQLEAERDEAEPEREDSSEPDGEERSGSGVEEPSEPGASESNERTETATETTYR